MRKGKRTFAILSVLVIFSMILAACGGAATPAPAAPAVEAPAAEAAPTEAPAAEAPAEAAPTEAPAEEAAPAVEGFDRAKTVIMDIDGGRLATAEGVWNPYLPGNRRDQGFHQVCLEPLLILNYQTGELMPWLAESFTSNETLDVWTLKLRDGVTWQDGEAFNADDVVFTMNMFLNTPELEPSAAQKQWVASVEKIDDLTVQFNLTAPNPRYPLDYWSVKIWGGPNIAPEHIWKDVDPATFNNYDPARGLPMCTGPYKLASTTETEVTWVRDDNWWGAATGAFKLPEPEKFIWTWAGPEETRAALMADGQLDSLMDITLGALQALQTANPNVITWFTDAPYAWVPDPCSRTLELNNTVEPWNDPEMRWALNYALNRDEIVAIAYEGTTLPSRHFFPAYPPLDAYIDNAIAAGAYDVDKLWTSDAAKADEIFVAKGYTKNGDGYYEKDGKVLSLDIATNEAFIEKQRIAAVLVEQFQRAGINASTRNEAAGTWGDNFQMGNYEARMGWQTCGSVNEPWASLNTFNTRWLKPVGERTGESENAWRWSGEKAEAYGALVDEMGTLPLGDPQVQELFNQAMTLWEEELPAIPITQAKKIIPFDTTYWTGWPTYDNQYIHPPTWWQHFHVIMQNLQATGAQ
jgi:peptide/nickel transport system substrate-binding protein